MPIVVGELGDFGVDRLDWKKFNKILKKYAKKNGNIEIVKTSDLKTMSDNVHFNNVSLRILGKRYADLMPIK